MSAKTDRPQVRTAQELERKYNFYGIETNIQQNKLGITKVSNELYQFANAVAGNPEILQRQLDGEIDTWYGDTIPTLLNKPASDWDASEYSDHVDDMYYDRTTGITYVFTEDNGTYSWEQTNSTYLSEVLAIANKAQETADDKRAVFFETEPKPPYSNGDIWINNKKIYICQFTRDEGETFDEQDFIIGTDYVDGTDAEKIGEDLIRVYDGQVTQKIDAQANKVIWDFQTNVTNPMGEAIDEIHDYIKFEGASIKLIAGNSIYSLKIENDRIQIYRDNIPISNWIQSTFTAKQVNIGLLDSYGDLSSGFAFIPRQNGSLSFRKVK